jgi:hypothetical protein
VADSADVDVRLVALELLLRHLELLLSQTLLASKTVRKRTSETYSVI